MKVRSLPAMTDRARLAVDTKRIESFPPTGDTQARVVILGSMPGEMSLAQQQYYAHPRNVFWDIMGELFGAQRVLPYDERVQVLTRQRIAVWDVLRYCERAGSLDSAITAEIANDFVAFFAARTEIHTVFFNGAKAQSAFRRLVEPTLPAWVRLRFEKLPSTSPAHAGKAYAEKLRAWRLVQAAREAPQIDAAKSCERRAATLRIR